LGGAPGSKAPSAPAIEEKGNHDYGNDQPDRANSPSGAHAPIQSPATAEQQQQKYDDQYGIHISPWQRITTLVLKVQQQREIVPVSGVGGVSDAPVSV
jgi:hypothetical protein